MRKSLLALAAGLLLAGSVSAASAADKLKVGFIYLGTIGDLGWTYQHELARQALVKEFGDNRIVDLRTGVADHYPTGGYSISSPPAIYNDLAILGPSTQETGRYGPSGDPRAFDIRTGKIVWRFHLVPRLDI